MPAPPWSALGLVLPFQWLAVLLAEARGLEPAVMRHGGLSRELAIKTNARTMNEPEAVAVGIDVGGTTIKMGLVDPGGRVLARRRIAYASMPTFEALADAIAADVRAMAQTHDGRRAASASPRPATRRAATA